MIINKQVTVAKINTMADGTIRLSIDILNGTPDDISNAYALREMETTMILAPSNVINSVITDELGNGEIEREEAH